MSRGWSYKSGEWNFVCDVCGKKLKAHEGKKRWDGFMVCQEDWEPRQPLDFLRARADKISVPWTRPQPEDQFVVINLTTVASDVIPISEEVITVGQYYRVVGVTDYFTDTDLINGSAINLLTINSNSIDPPSPATEETFTVSESISLSQGFGVSVSDTITLTESIVESEAEFSIDSMALSESVVVLNTTNKLLNAHLYNEVLLG